MVRFTLDPNHERIYFIEPKFIKYVRPFNFTAAHERLLKSIDNAEILDRNIGSVVTPFGITGLSNLSSGCKTALLVQEIINGNTDLPDDVIIDLVSCGYNAVKEIIRIADNTGIQLYWGTSFSENIQGEFELNGNVYSDTHSMLLARYEDAYN